VFRHQSESPKTITEEGPKEPRELRIESEKEESDSEEEESSDTDNDDEEAEFSMFQVCRFIRDVKRAIDQEDPHHKDMNLQACIEFKCPHHPNGAKNLQNLV
jgi:hypothetical protein